MNKILKAFWDRAKDCYDLKELERLGLTPTLEQREMILTLLAMILKWNKAAGLVSPNDEHVLFLRHFCDSLQPLLLFGFKKRATILDIGAGGGFPSIPICIFRPDLSFILADSNKKKAAFLGELKKETACNNLEIYSGRLETLAKEGKRFDYVISRGLGTLKKFASMAKPLLMPDGHMYTFKAKNFQSELEEVTMGKETEGIRIAEIAEYDLANQIHGLKLVSLEIIS
jgi:16S rRNA (guanine527-N7)-methyltransferase